MNSTFLKPFQSQRWIQDLPQEGAPPLGGPIFLQNFPKLHKIIEIGAFREAHAGTPPRIRD